MKTTEQTTTLEDKIQGWKKEWGKVYKTTVGDDTVIWRKLKRKEYNTIMSSTNEAETEEDIIERTYNRQVEIAKVSVLYPENIAELIEDKCGLAPSIADLVMFKSGFIVATETEEL